ncbi:MAG: S8 family serine peptidase, partial [Lysobacter sp.]
FGSDDFRVDSATRLSMLSASGLMVSGASLAATAASITWSVFPDNNGMPAGDPYASPQLAVWSYTAAPNSVGVRITGADIRLDLIAAGQNVNLPAGRYWLVVHTRSSAANRWAWVISDTGDSSIRGNVIAPNGIGAWGPTAVPYAGLAMRVEEQGVCGAAWIGAPNRAFGRIVVGANYTTQVQISAAGLAPGTHEGFLCVASNDVINPKRAVRVVLTVQ